MIALDYPALLESGNLRAFLRVVREGESSQDDDLAYRMRYGGAGQPVAYFDAFDQHPRIFAPTPTGQVSSAAGAYQIVATTWDAVCRDRYGLGPAFDPYTQDCAAVALIHNRAALDDVLAGRFDTALAKLGNEWASLPDSPLQDGGSKLAYRRALDTYLRWGGSIYRPEAALEEPAPIEERGRPAASEDVERITAEEQPMAPALILGLISSLAEIFSPLLRAKLTKTLDKTTGDAAISGQVADKILDFAKEAAAQALPGVAPPPGSSGAPAPAAAPLIDPVVAVGMVKSNPALAAQVEAQVASYLEQIAPALDRIERMEQAAWSASEASMNAAAARARDELHDTTNALLWGGIAFVGVLLVFVCGVIAMQVARGQNVGSEMWAALTGLIGWATAQMSVIYAYRFGSSRSSGAKDVVISELATAKRRT